MMRIRLKDERKVRWRKGERCEKTNVVTEGEVEVRMEMERKEGEVRKENERREYEGKQKKMGREKYKKKVK